MADGGSLKIPNLEVKIDSSSLVSFTKMLRHLNQDRGLEKYWKTSEELIQDAIKAYEQFTKVASNDNATELLKVVNALKAIENTNLSGLSNILPNFENMAKGINKALSQIDLNEAFSADSFREAFASFDMLKVADVDMEKLFSRFKNSSEVNELRNVIENLNDELLKTRNNLEGVISEKENIQREFNNLADNSGFSELKGQISDLEDELINMKFTAEKEFTDFLKVNGFGDYDIANNDIFSEYFDGINSGYLSANEAIAKFRLEHNDLLKSMFKESGDNLGIERLQEFANKLDEVFKKTEEISKNITNIMTNGVISKATTNMLEQDLVPEGYEETFRKMSEGSSNLSSTLDVLVKIINETTGASTNMNDMYSSIAQVFSAIKDVSSIELDNLSALYGVVNSLSKLNDLKIDKTPLENLAVALERLVKIENPTALHTISNVNLNRFNELKVSKASLNNLAEYLPKIASVNYRDLIELTNLDFNKLSENLTINKSAIQSLVEFTNGLKESDAVKQFIENNKNVDSSAEKSTKSINTEAELMESISKNATTAANAKREFAKANKDVKKSADDSSGSLGSEADAMKRVEDAKGKKKAGKSDASDVKAQKANYAELLNALSRYETLRKKIANGNALEGDADEADELLKRILELNKSGIISDENLKKSTQRLEKLGNDIYDILRKRTSEFFDDLDKKIKEYESKESSYKSKPIENDKKYTSNLSDFSEDLDKLKEKRNNSNFPIVSDSARDGLNDLVDRINKSSSTLDGIVKSKIEEQENNYKQLKNHLKEYETLRKKIANGKGSNADVEEAERLLGLIQELNKKDIISDEAFDEVKKRLGDLGNELYHILKNNSQSYVEKINDDIDKYNSSLEKYKNKNPEEELRSPDYKNAIKNYSDAIKNLKKHLDEVSKMQIISDDAKVEIGKLSKAVEDAESKIKTFSAVEKGLNLNSASKLINDISKYLKDNTNISEQAKNVLKSYIKTLENGNYTNLSKIADQWREIQVAERSAHRDGKRFFDILKDKYTYGFAAQFAGYFLSISDFMRYASQGFNVIREFDTALTELKKVSDETNGSLENFQKHSFAIADSVGTTAKQLQQSTADYMRLGESLDQAAESARVANILLNVSEFENISDATDSLAAMGQAYKNLEKIEIVDKLNEVGKVIIANLYGNMLKIKMAITVKNQRWSRPWKDCNNINWLI